MARANDGAARVNKRLAMLNIKSAEPLAHARGSVGKEKFYDRR
jgi:hypothetical protein